MKDVSCILDDYRKKNFEDRLNLFLECPELRQDFIDMDRREAAGQKLRATNHGSRVKVGGKCICSPVHRYLKRAITCCR